jgi:FHA domain
MAEQLSHIMSRVGRTTDVGSHLTRFRKYRDERTGYYMLSIEGEPYNLPLISVSAPQPPMQTSASAHQQHSYTATLLPIFPAAIQTCSGTEDTGEKFLQFAPPWTATQLSQTEVTTIGREPGANLCINDPTISRRHAQIACIRQRYVLHDLDSKNGTFVNDTRLEPDKVWLLNANDRIRFGKGMTYIFQVHPTDFTT